MRASALIAVLLTFGVAAPADASQGFGADLSQPAVDGCGMLNQTCAAFSEAHASPQTGILTAVRLRYGGSAESVRFLVLRQSGDGWLNTEPLIDAAATAGDGNLIVLVRRPIQQGDRLGLQVLGSPSDFQFKASGGTCLFSSGEHAAGQVKSYDACNGITEPQGESSSAPSRRTPTATASATTPRTRTTTTTGSRTAGMPFRSIRPSRPTWTMTGSATTPTPTTTTTARRMPSTSIRSTRPSSSTPTTTASATTPTPTTTTTASPTRSTPSRSTRRDRSGPAAPRARRS